jgi:mannose-6-phosphate isomerase-like protein (cupin superfamily)
MGTRIPDVVDLQALARTFALPRTNRVIAEVNENCLRLAVSVGTFPWHSHPNSDECFVVLEGELIVDFQQGQSTRLGPRDSLTVPAGVVHQTRAEGRTVNLCFERTDAATKFVVEG